MESLAGTKRCGKCGEWKGLGEFQLSSRGKLGRHTYCKLCYSHYHRERYLKNREAILAKMRERRLADPERHRAIAHASAERNRDRRNARIRQRRKENPLYFRRMFNAWAEKNREKIRASGKKLYWKDPQKDIERKKRAPEWSKEKARMYRKQWREANRDRLGDIRRAWYDRDPERVKAMARATTLRRRARKRSLPDCFTIDDWSNCLRFWGNACSVCEQREDLFYYLTADHWIPLKSPSCPGTVPWNLVPMCGSRKGATGGCNREKWANDAERWLTEKLGPQAAAKKLAEIEAYFTSVRPVLVSTG